MKKPVAAIQTEKSSGNVFADLGLPDAEEHFAKAQIVSRIEDVIRVRKLTQKQAADLMGIDQPKVSAILSGVFRGYSVERLLRFLMALGFDVEIRIKETPRSRSTGRLKVA